MKQKILLILLALTLIVVSSCTEGSGPGPGTHANFVGGTRGVEMSFVTNAPPREVADQGQDSFEVVVDLLNRGEHEVPPEDVFVELEGFSPITFGVTHADLIQYSEYELAPVYKSPDGLVIHPTSSPVIFTGFNYGEMAPNDELYTFRAKVCYKYETIAVSDICVKPRYNLDEEHDLCRVSGPRKISNSGAPIQVSEIRQVSRGIDRTEFTFTIQHKDPDLKGRVSSPDSQCDTQSFTNKDKVFVRVSGIIENPATDTVTCRGLIGGDSSSGYATITRNQPTTVSCVVYLENRNTRIEPFRVNIVYDYTTYIDETVRVIHTPT